MRILIAYATTEGQTRKIARHISEMMGRAGHSVELLNAEDCADTKVARFDAVVLAGSVHAGRYQAPLVEFAGTNVSDLSALPGLFLSVSLTAAGADPDEKAELDRIARHFVEETGWAPRRVEQVAGAFRFSEYGFFSYWAMRWIAARKEPGVTGHEDIEYTDWPALDAIVTDWLAGIGTPPTSAPKTGTASAPA